MMATAVGTLRADRTALLEIGAELGAAASGNEAQLASPAPCTCSERRARGG